MTSWAEEAQNFHDGHWSLAIEQKYRFHSPAAESLMTENSAGTKKLPPNTYTGNLPCFLRESRYVSVHERGARQNEILKRIKDLSAFILLINDYLPLADLTASRKNALEIDLRVSGDNKIALFYLCNVFEKYDQGCLAIFQHKKKITRKQPTKIQGVTIKDWHADYVNYVRRRSRGIFQAVRLAGKECARKYEAQKHPTEAAE